MKTDTASKPPRPRSRRSALQRLASAYKKHPRWVLFCGLFLLQLAIALTYLFTALLAPDFELPAWPAWIAKAAVVAIVAIIASWFVTYFRNAKVSEASRKQWRELWATQPVQSVLVLLGGVLLFVIAPVTLLFRMIITPDLVLSNDLRGLTYVSAGVAALLGLFTAFMVLRQPRAAKTARPRAVRTARDRLRDLVIVVFTPVLLAIVWAMFMSGPASFALHLIAPKQTQWVSVPVTGSGSSPRRGFACAGIWMATLHDDSFWWPQTYLRHQF
jgi:hypothetical protein